MGRPPARRGDIGLGGQGYVSAGREAAFSGPGKFWGVMSKARKGGALHPVDEDINRIIAMVRARVGHPFRLLKRQFGYLETRYRGLANNRAQLLTLFALKASSSLMVTKLTDGFDHEKSRGFIRPETAFDKAGVLIRKAGVLIRHVRSEVGRRHRRPYGHIHRDALVVGWELADVRCREADPLLV